MLNFPNSPKKLINILCCRNTKAGTIFKQKGPLLRKRNSTWIRIQILFKENKNIFSGQANCKKTTRHYAHLSLCAKSRKTNDAKSRKWPKNLIWQFFDDFEVKYLQIADFSEKYISFKLKIIFSTNFRPKNKKLLQPFSRKIWKCLILG